MRSYRQYCGLARGLDLIGDRWVLLIVRELLLGTRRYGELLDGLPGIATNLLADRLRAMEDNGLVVKGDDDRYGLTERGEGLRDVVYAIGRWAYPLMGEMGPEDTRPELPVEVRSGGEAMTVRSGGGRVTAEWGPAPAPDLVLTGPPDTIISLFAQRINVDEAKTSGLAVTGDPRQLRKLRPPRR